MGRKMPFLLVKKYAICNWINYGLEGVISTGLGVYLLKFKEIDEMMKVLDDRRTTLVYEKMGQEYLYGGGEH